MRGGAAFAVILGAEPVCVAMENPPRQTGRFAVPRTLFVEVIVPSVIAWPEIAPMTSYSEDGAAVWP